ncbi:MAG: hypothetical protein ACE5EU_09300 [Paracoccaceae bacterium]
MSFLRAVCSFGLCLAATASLATPGTAVSQTTRPVAIVEDASINAPVAVFDYLVLGQRIELNPEQSVVIGYLASCRLETITGGVVIIGEERSTLTGGTIDADQVECDGGQIELTRENAAASGVAVYRTGADVEMRLYSATPVFLLPAAGADDVIEIERIDRAEPTHRFTARSGRFDLADAGAYLNPGGIYMARNGDREIAIRVVVYARPGGPLVGRIAQF